MTRYVSFRPVQNGNAINHCLRGLKMNTYTIRSFVKAIMNGSKFIYQTVPRMLTIWLDVGEDKRACQEDSYKKMTDVMAKAFKEAPAYKVCTETSTNFVYNRNSAL